MSPDVIRLVAERKIEEAIEDGQFDNLPLRGRIDCSLQGEAFLVQWWREKIEAIISPPPQPS